MRRRKEVKRCNMVQESGVVEDYGMLVNTGQDCLEPKMGTFAETANVVYPFNVCRQRKTNFHFPFPFAANKRKLPFSGYIFIYIYTHIHKHIHTPPHI